MRLAFFVLIVAVAVSDASLALAAGNFPATLAPSTQCRAAIAAAERSTGVPDRLMRAIGIVESGRRDEAGGTTAWPWTINAEGAGAYFNTKAEAIAAVNSLRARGVRSIDVGCMQVNLMYHPDAFASLEEAFDPGANARYAASFLQRLFAQTGSWSGAAAGYHSLKPEIGGPYARKVLAVCNQPETPGLPQASSPPSPAPQAPRPAQQLAQAPSPAPIRPVTTSLISSSIPARIIPLPAAAASAGLSTGRGLDSYRAAPTRLASRAMPGRV